mmetsp:Transcript_40199/g.114883  ORF Transcript_40199/g.114883 Transcript_40199/m.114883 type:complete len:202 (+) Transcript_40199:588-1193(+)
MFVAGPRCMTGGPDRTWNALPLLAWCSTGSCAAAGLPPPPELPRALGYPSLVPTLSLSAAQAVGTTPTGGGWCTSGFSTPDWRPGGAQCPWPGSILSAAGPGMAFFRMHFIDEPPHGELCLSAPAGFSSLALSFASPSNHMSLRGRAESCASPAWNSARGPIWLLMYVFLRSKSSHSRRVKSASFQSRLKGYFDWAMSRLS